MVRLGSPLVIAQVAFVNVIARIRDHLDKQIITLSCVARF